MNKITRMNKERTMKYFDNVFDSYNDKKITKENMIKQCKRLFRQLPMSFIKRGV